MLPRDISCSFADAVMSFSLAVNAPSGVSPPVETGGLTV